MRKKRGFILFDKGFFLILLLFSLFLGSCKSFFENPADPEADNYIGYELIIGKNKTKNILPIHGEKIPFPAFSWEKCDEGSVYAIQIATNNEFATNQIKYQTLDLKENFIGLFDYDSSKNWRVSSAEEYFRNLPVGYYWWRVAVENNRTGNYLSDWSNPTFFEQKLHLKEMYWDYGEEAIISYKQGFQYFYNFTGRVEKEISFLKFDSEPDARYLDSTLTFLDGDFQIQEKHYFDGSDCDSRKIVKKIKYEYEKDSKKRTIKRRKWRVERDLAPVAPPLLEEEEIVVYESEISFAIKAITNFKKMTEDSDQLQLYYQSEYVKGKQHKTSFYRMNATTNELEINYYYFMFYSEDYPSKPTKATYYMKNDTTGEFELYRDYIVDYNFPQENNIIVIGPGGTIDLNEASEEKVNFKRVDEPLRIISSSDINSFVSE